MGSFIINLFMLNDYNESVETPRPRRRRRKRIMKPVRKIPASDYTLLWSLIENPHPLKHLLILPGDCILPLSSSALQSTIEDLYLKISSIKIDGRVELTLSRKVRPFRDIEQLVLLLERIHSPFVARIKALLLGDYRQYIDRKRQEQALPFEHQPEDFE